MLQLIEKAKNKYFSIKLMLTEEQIQTIEKIENIKRETRPDGKCVFGINEKGEGCGRPAVNWLPIMEGYVD